MPDLILVRATIYLPGLPLGDTALVDPSDPYIAECLANQYIVPLYPPLPGDNAVPAVPSDA